MKLELYIEKFKRKVHEKSTRHESYNKIAKKLSYKIKKKMKRNSGDTRLLNWAGIMSLETHDIDHAYKMFRVAARISPNVQALNNLGYFYLYEYGDVEKALEVLEKAAKLTSKSEFTYSLLGEAYLESKEFAKAERAFKIAINLKTTRENQNNLGASVYRQGKIVEATSWFQKACEFETGEGLNWQSRLNYGVCLAQTGQLEKAEEIAFELINYVQAFLGLGKSVIYLDLGFLEVADIYYETQNYSMANELFRLSIEQMNYGFSPSLVSMYQYSLIQCGKIQEARLLLEKAILCKKEEIKLASDYEGISEEEYQECIKEYTSEIELYEKLFESILQGYRPSASFDPYILRKCYLYGCFRHDHPEFS